MITAEGTIEVVKLLREGSIKLIKEGGKQTLKLPDEEVGLKHGELVYSNDNTQGQDVKLTDVGLLIHYLADMLE